MKYCNEYQKFVKKITDKFISKLTYNTAVPIEEYNIPKYKIINDEILFYYLVDDSGNLFYGCDEAPQEMGGVIKRPKEVVEAWMEIENENAMKWLKKNLITYSEWLNKNQ